MLACASCRRADGVGDPVLTPGSCSSFAAVVLRIVYGLDPEQGERKYYKLVERLATIAEDISTPGRHIVEAFPSMQRLPSWFPGTGFKQLATTWKAEIASIRDYLYDSAKETMVSALLTRSRTHDLIGAVGYQRRQRVDHHQTDGRARGRRTIKECNRHDLRWCVYPSTDTTTTIFIQRYHKPVRIRCVACLIRGAERLRYEREFFLQTNAAVHAFVLAMAMFPEAQRKAQAELDAVVGPDRLPDFADQKSLPYVSALMKEVLRWHVVAPIGVPHRSTEADEYGGYYLPGGSLIIVNQWSVYSSLTVRSVA